MWIILNDRSVLEITGPDRFSFLQGLVTQDMTQLTERTPLYSLFLTNSGRFFCDFFLLEQGESIFLTPGTAVLESFRKKLLFYKLRSNIDIIARSDWKVAISVEEEPASFKEGIVFSDPRLEGLGTLFVGPSTALIQGTNDQADYDNKRLLLGVPEGPLDLEVEKSIPLENWMDELKAISWTKGCFLGQELTSRTKHVGTVRKKLLSFSCASSLVPDETLFTIEKEEVGKVVSVYQEGTKGFALVYVEKIPENKQVFASRDDKSFSVQLHYPVFKKRS
jgi:tRNA-modifying protein YgfZ